MSRGFVREGDQEEEPIIAPRAPLPDGHVNHVTIRGMEMLEEERSQLESEKKSLRASDPEKNRVEIRIRDIQLAQLIERINSAHVAEPGVEKPEEVRFGCTVTYAIGSAPSPITFQIVGVDEADVKEGKIAFTSPIAKALIGMKVGEEKAFELGNESRLISILSIA